MSARWIQLILKFKSVLWNIDVRDSSAMSLFQLVLLLRHRLQVPSSQVGVNVTAEFTLEKAPKLTTAETLSLTAVLWLANCLWSCYVLPSFTPQLVLISASCPSLFTVTCSMGIRLWEKFGPYKSRTVLPRQASQNDVIWVRLGQHNIGEKSELV